MGCAPLSQHVVCWFPRDTPSSNANATRRDRMLIERGGGRLLEARGEEPRRINRLTNQPSSFSAADDESKRVIHTARV